MASAPQSPVRLVCISDTHGRHEEVTVPEGDVLVHAGDLTGRGEVQDLRAVNEWLGRLPHAEKVVIAGNHDFCLERDPAAARAAITHATYLQDEAVTLCGLRFWGSPWQPWFYDWAFNLRRGAPLRERWDLIAADTDVLVTHGPPAGVLDVTSQGAAVGCEELTAAVARVRPRLHVFGHIHESYGEREAEGTRYVNAAICDHHFEPSRRPVVVDLPAVRPP